jgi:hypothetical protein
MIQGASAVTLMGAVNLVVRQDQPTNARGKLALLLTCLVAGAGVGAVYFATESLRARGGWRAGVANVAAGLVYCGLAVGLLALAAVTGLLGN